VEKTGVRKAEVSHHLRRTDWEYGNNTFVYPVNIGYRFIAATNGAANGQFSCIGADEEQQFRVALFSTAQIAEHAIFDF
jgi:hypothetical protein